MNLTAARCGIILLASKAFDTASPTLGSCLKRGSRQAALFILRNPYTFAPTPCTFRRTHQSFRPAHISTRYRPALPTLDVLLPQDHTKVFGFDRPTQMRCRIEDHFFHASPARVMRHYSAPPPA